MYLNNGNDAYSRKEYDKAVEYYSKALEEWPKDAIIYYNLGTTYIKMKNFQAAIPCFLKAIHFGEKRANYYHNLAICYTRVNKIEDALLNFLEAKKINNKDPDIEKGIQACINTQPDLKKYLDKVPQLKLIKLDYEAEEFFIDGKKEEASITVGNFLEQQKLLDNIDKALEDKNEKQFKRLTNKLKKLKI